MAEPEPTEAGPCTFLFKKSTKKFAGRKRKASDSNKGRLLLLHFSNYTSLLLYKPECAVFSIQEGSWKVALFYLCLITADIF